MKKMSENKLMVELIKSIRRNLLLLCIAIIMVPVLFVYSLIREEKIVKR